MKMHSPKFRDPWIRRAEPVNLMIPIIEETLRLAGVTANREQIIDRFMKAAPRIAIVRGGEDHPPALGSTELTRRIARQLWMHGGLPFPVTQSFPCEELARGTEGAHYALLARNFCTANMAAHMEAHGYDGAIVMGACDKMIVGNLRALIEADLSRQRKRTRPVFAFFIPSVIPREVYASEDEKRRFDPLKSKLPQAEREELQTLLHLPLGPEVYARVNALLDRSFQLRLIQEVEKDTLACAFLKCSAVQGGNCAASQASMIHRMMIASFGIVPRQFDFLTKAPADDQVGEMAKRLVGAIQKRERRMSVAGLCRSNLINAAAVWSATGGHPGWLLHLIYLADAIGKKLTIQDVVKKADTVPHILATNSTPVNSAYRMAVEREAGGNSGIDTLMRTLAEKRFVEDRAPTLDGPWMQRIMEARSASGTFLYSTMTPYSPSCGLSSIQGNVCTSGVLRVGNGRAPRSGSDRQLYLAVSYLGMQEMLQDLLAPEALLDRLKRKVDRDDLYLTWQFNQRETPAEAALWNKNQLWDFLIAHAALRIMIVVAGAGPHAAGMPELQLRFRSMPALDSMSVIVTDGRVSFQHDGISISHVVPEAYDGGALAAIQTGDWVFLDVANRQLQVVCRARNTDGFKALSTRELLNRPEAKKQVREVVRRRSELMPSFRVLLDHVSSADSGVCPTN